MPYLILLADNLNPKLSSKPTNTYLTKKKQRLKKKTIRLKFKHTRHFLYPLFFYTPLTPSIRPGSRARADPDPPQPSNRVTSNNTHLLHPPYLFEKRRKNRQKKNGKKRWPPQYSPPSPNGRYCVACMYVLGFQLAL